MYAHAIIEISTKLLQNFNITQFGILKTEWKEKLYEIPWKFMVYRKKH